jgi:SAM-dependent methyltransferase|tara:strand:+ start:1416 stop:2543 length:1128 start_codon:yes stop_codon:yes gene_type:complete
LIDHLHKTWNVLPQHITSDEFTGYESVYDQLDAFDKAQYDADPQGTIEKVYNIYRSIDLVPIVYYTHKGLVDAVRAFSKLNYNNVDNNKIGLGNNRGQTINRFLFPNMMTAEPKGRGSNSLRDRFLDERKLKRAIRICFEFRTGERLLRPTQLRTALELVTGENVTNFKAQNAKAIAEHLCPVLWGNVYDYSCGYGGRLLGIGSSNFKYKYIGVEPNTETVNYLNYLNDIIDEATGVRGTIIQSVSEQYQPEDIDLAFSSPPYFNLEKYSNEETQCMVQFKTEDEWFEGYVAPTMENIKRGLNDDGIFATNIADYKSYDRKEPYEVVQRWIQTAEKVGFKYDGVIKMMLNTRPGVGNDRKEGREKWEGVYVFRKN